MLNWLIEAHNTMRTAALDRHEMLVNFWYPPGVWRDGAKLQHELIVASVYGH